MIVSIIFILMTSKKVLGSRFDFFHSQRPTHTWFNLFYWIFKINVDINLDVQVLSLHHICFIQSFITWPSVLLKDCIYELVVKNIRIHENIFICPLNQSLDLKLLFTLTWISQSGCTGECARLEAAIQGIKC